MKRKELLHEKTYINSDGNWVLEEKYKDLTVRVVYPTGKGDTFEQAEERVSNHASKLFAERFVKDCYVDLLCRFDLEHDEDLYNIVHSFRLAVFGNNEVEREKESVKLQEKIIEMVKLKEKLKKP